MKETFGLWSLLAVGSSMWISITVLSVISINFYPAAAMQPRYCDVWPSVCPSYTCIVTKRKQLLPVLLYLMKSWVM